LPEWAQSDRYADETVLGATELFWKVFATRYRGRTAIFAYDLLNEPEIRWDTPAMAARWNSWLEKRYGSVAKLKAVWGKSNAELILGKIPVPPREDCPGCSRLTDFQHFREEVADEWTRRQAKAIKAADPQALVTVGMIQWSVPALLAAGWQYSGFRPARQAPLVDFLEIHFYPLANGVYQYAPPDEASNLAYLESVMAEVSGFHKPVVIAEFGWYGGGQPTFGKYAAATEEQQAHWCSKVVTSTAGNACGWLNWGFYDSPGAGDASEFSGLLTADGRLKAWGTEFKKLVGRYQNGKWNLQARGPRPRLDWDLSITSAAEGTKFRKEYLEAWQEERR
jgi:hypothetical protein